MLEKTLLDQLESLSPAQRLELIGHVWELLDADGLPIGDRNTVIPDLPIGEPTAPRPG
ncbi:hypothetical protein DFR24_2408 [Panacagrimonas perspica]|uniref:Addiction module component n=2 Tax=Panacagrimonas perspica TaxID=381431 RepID=A0A4R7P3V4_9GAMM|nr:hypothetical protein [Panacagrimonas perspica]TDU28049.1 hypothetical protein DFR24_2408 [Panacagrimonas perspica]